MRVLGREGIERQIWRLWTLCAFAASISIFVYPAAKGQLWGLVPVFLGMLICVGLSSCSEFLEGLFERGTSRTWLAGVLVLGAAVRLPAILYPSPMRSDMLNYHHGAVALASGWAGFGADGIGIYYPPGQSMWLSLWIMAFGDHAILLSLAQNVLALASVVLIYKSFSPANELGARLGSLVAAAYPSLVLWSATLGHETTQVFLLALLLFLYTRVSKAVGMMWWLLWSAFGLVLGFGVLLRPTFLLLLPLTAITELLKSARPRIVLGGVVCASVCSALVIAPWTLRNERVYGQFCLISANAGFNLLAVVHPNSNGITSDTSAIGEGLDIVSRDKLHMSLARQAILRDPLRIAGLGFRKILWVWGSDTSMMDSVVGDPPRGGETLKKGIQGFVNVFWAFFVCCWVAACVFGSPWKKPASRPELWTASWVLTIFALHSLFEPQSRHHLPLLPFMAAVAGPSYLAFLRSLQLRPAIAEPRNSHAAIASYSSL